MDSEKIKKFFSIAAPTVNLRNRGRGCTSQKCSRNILGMKYPVFAICVRTQIDVCRKGGITAHPNNKIRLKRLICVHNGHHARKQDGTWRKMNIYAIILL